MSSAPSGEQGSWDASCFPDYAGGNVCIVLVENPFTEIHLHRTTLARHSKWFEVQFQSIDKVRQLNNVKKSGYQFKLVVNPKHAFLSLLLVTNEDQSSGARIPPNTAAGVDEPHIKAEDEDTKLDAAKIEEINSRKQLLIWTGYSNFFNAVYLIPPKLGCSDLPPILDQCEALVEVAAYLEGLPAVRMYISNSLTELRHRLYTAIAQDPVRWLNLAVRLNSKVIFSEALIHCVGGFPGMAWPTPSTKILQEAQQVTFEKAMALDSWAKRVDMHLLENTLRDKTSGKAVSPEYGRGSWVVVSIFRDWLLEQKRKLHKRRYQCQFATVYRQIYKGGEAYLKLEDVDMLVNEVLGPSYNFYAEDSLDKLKNSAKEAVAPVIKNNLMIDPEIAEIPYLTCVEVEEQDYPWERD